MFDGTTVLQVLSQHLNEAPRRPSERVACAIPAALEEVLMRCLEKDPAQRYASVTALLGALRAASVGSWTEEEARAWWAARGDAMVAHVRRGEAIEQTLAPALGAGGDA